MLAHINELWDLNRGYIEQSHPGSYTIQFESFQSSPEDGSSSWLQNFDSHLLVDSVS
jgi:hypothetical protein